MIDRESGTTGEGGSILLLLLTAARRRRWGRKRRDGPADRAAVRRPEAAAARRPEAAMSPEAARRSKPGRRSARRRRDGPGGRAASGPEGDETPGGGDEVQLAEGGASDSRCLWPRPACRLPRALPPLIKYCRGDALSYPA